MPWNWCVLKVMTDMSNDHAARFEAKLRQPAESGTGEPWAFLVLPKAASDMLPRRGRTSVEGVINGHPFRAVLDPDGQLSHWLKVDQSLLDVIDADIGDEVDVQLKPADREQEPRLPDDLRKALAGAPEAAATWDATTTIARIDWVHWVESAKQAKTRKRRVDNACDMLASGKKRVCCFDQSGYYDKSQRAPREAE